MPRRPSLASHAPADETAAAALRDKPSKTQRKAQAHDVQKLGAELAALSDDQLARIPMDDALRDVIVDLRRTRSHEGRRRQLQLVGKVMRSVDAQPLREALAQTKLGRAEDSLVLHRAEYWRDALVADDAKLAAFTAEHPDVDATQLRALVTRARSEKAGQTTTPQGATRHGKAWRELFQLIRPVISAALTPP